MEEKANCVKTKRRSHGPNLDSQVILWNEPRNESDWKVSWENSRCQLNRQQSPVQQISFAAPPFWFYHWFYRIETLPLFFWGGALSKGQVYNWHWDCCKKHILTWTNLQALNFHYCLQASESQRKRITFLRQQMPGIARNHQNLERGKEGFSPLEHPERA